MKILWIKSDFLHPTTKGGHIRTLEMLRHLHRRHEIHYVAFDDGRNREGIERAGEYSTRAYPVPFELSAKGSFRFYKDVLASIFSPLPVQMSRRRSAAMHQEAANLMKREKFDALVCDFLFPSLNLPELERWTLFQHNVEVMIWRRQVENATHPLRRAYLKLQADRLFRFERDVCRKVRRVIAVSEVDAAMMREMFGATAVSAVPTGADVEYFTPPPAAPAKTRDLAFVGSMDWSPNVDGILFFVKEILPLIRERKPGCTLDIVGRSPEPAIRKLAEGDPRIVVHGTVPDVRPYLWNAKVSIVPLRIGGGTRLKIYEAMAAKVATVSTTIGAEGLDVRSGENILIADSPEAFAAGCLDLLERPAERGRLANAAWEMVNTNFSWGRVASEFERLLRT